jgi:hypothetical protein
LVLLAQRRRERQHLVGLPPFERNPVRPRSRVTGNADRHAQKVSCAERQGHSARLGGWRQLDDRGAIQKSFKFKDFSAAFGLMTRMA